MINPTQLRLSAKVRLCYWLGGGFIMLSSSRISTATRIVLWDRLACELCDESVQPTRCPLSDRESCGASTLAWSVKELFTVGILVLSYVADTVLYLV